MRKAPLTLFTFAAILLAAPAARAQDEDPGGFRVFWNDGLYMETNDGRFQMRIGGRIQYDWVFWGDDSKVADAVAGPIVDGTEFRRARLFVQGYMYDKIEYKAQFDFAGGEVNIKDLYFGIRHPKYGFRMGHMKEPFSFEELTSSKYLTFLERALPTVLDSERNSGFLLHGNLIGGRWNYGVGVFREAGGDGIGTLSSRYNLTGRFAGPLVYEDEGRKVFHVGGSATFQNDSGGNRLFRQRPEVHLSPPFINSGVVQTDSVAVLGFEGLGIVGPFSVQTEWKVVPVASEETGDPTFWGWYAYGSWFITDENRSYSNTGMQRIRPHHNFLDGDGGLGAWEVALRYSALDLTAPEADKSESVAAGTRLDNVTLGLNWYWNPMTLMRFNLVRADVQDVGAIWAFTWRGQLEF